MPAQVEVQTQIGLWSDPVERTPLCSQTEITGSGRKFERTTVWTIVWTWSDKRSIWSDKSDHRRIRAHLGLIRTNFERNWVWSEMFSNAIWSDQVPFWAPFFIFCFFYWKMLALSRGNNKAAFWSQTQPKSNRSDQKKESSWYQRPVPFTGNFYQLETTLFLMQSCLNSAIESEIYTKR